MKLSKIGQSWIKGRSEVAKSEETVASQPRASHVLSTVVGTARRDPLRKLLAPYFDEQYYLEVYFDVREAGIDALDHYINFGEREGRQPSPEFDPIFYAERYASSLGGKKPLQHYAMEGKAAGNLTSADGFDYDWYKRVYLNKNATNADCRQHYLENKRFNLLCKKGDDAFIKLREEFDSDFYLATYPAIGDLDPWMHYVGAGRREGRKIARWYRDGIGDIQKQVELVMREAWELQGIDLMLDRLDISGLGTLASSTPSYLDASNQALVEALNDIGSEISSLVATGSLGIGGAELYGINLFRALSKLHGTRKTILLVTDGERGKGEKWLPEDAKTLVISDYLPDADSEARAQFTRRLISIVQPESTYCVNSRALWDVMIKPKSAIGNFTKLRACLFCYDYTAEGAPVGYAATEFPQAFTLIDHFLIDNQTFVDQLISDFSIPANQQKRLQVLRTPVEQKKLPERAEKTQRRVFWSGRMSRQKLPEMIGKIAELCPSISFHLYSVPGNISTESLGLPANVKIEPPYDPDVGVPFEKYDAFLYTSLWDGIPTVLLDAASAGIPIVGSASGGISEILDNDTGWLVSDIYDPRQYARCLQEVCFTSKEASRRREAMFQRLNTQHSWEKFESIVKLVEQEEELAK
ncbi:glycosyltransferase involved in cell wall biosynthesis [Litoreibacter halocynthiae]|uniref:Glycosyltransferase involved in cell wall biosynthesis n=1 Tax=Litoreibacter halocynthiae TaxID=1242689 RepID=A0A4R7LFN2_9RHOB|nr:glycosyltransferase family 4 protein [Litoreibacter halocynthiae]TDT73131.1 glycosyltransferase involved in cell wall biosynthesis [Litoreibacter halocynthiae]